MLERLEKFFTNRLPNNHINKADQKDQRIEIATAALFLEMAYADFEIDPAEESQIVSALQNLFEMDRSDIVKLIREAGAERASKSDIWGFTSLIKDNFDRRERLDILEKLWLLIYADGRVDKYEDALIRKITSLLGLDHSDMIQAKLKMKPKKA